MVQKCRKDEFHMGVVFVAEWCTQSIKNVLGQISVRGVYSILPGYLKLGKGVSFEMGVVVDHDDRVETTSKEWIWHWCDREISIIEI